MTPPVRFTIINACDSSQRVLVAIETMADTGLPLHDRVVDPLQRSCFHLVPCIAVQAADEETGSKSKVTPITPGDVLGVIDATHGAIALTPWGDTSRVTRGQCGVVNLLPHLVTTTWYVDGVHHATSAGASQGTIQTFELRPALLFLAGTAGVDAQRYVVPPSVGEVTVTLLSNGMFAFDPPTA